MMIVQIMMTQPRTENDSEDDELSATDDDSFVIDEDDTLGINIDRAKLIPKTQMWMSISCVRRTALDMDF